MRPRFRHATLAAVLIPLLSVAFTGHAKTASEVYEQAARSTVVVENINADTTYQGPHQLPTLPAISAWGSHLGQKRRCAPTIENSAKIEFKNRGNAVQPHVKSSAA